VYLTCIGDAFALPMGFSNCSWISQVHAVPPLEARKGQLPNDQDLKSSEAMTASLQATFDSVTAALPPESANSSF
jgi:hypothetical protein